VGSSSAQSSQWQPSGLFQINEFSDVIRAVETAERQKQLEEKKAAGDDFWEDYERDLARLDEATEKIRELEAENANLRANQKLLFAGTLTADEPDEGLKDELLPISSVTEAVERLPSGHPMLSSSHQRTPRLAKVLFSGLLISSKL